LLFLPFTIGCSESRARRNTSVPVVVAQVERRSVPYEIEATGTVEPLQSAEVTSQVGGLVKRVGFREGEEVRAGQLLFQIDPGPYQAAAERAAAVLSRDRAQAEASRLQFQRAQALMERQVLSQQDFETKRADTEGLLATVRADSAALASARLDLEHSAVRAPIGGRSGSQMLHVGDLAKENGGVLVTINQMRPILVRFTLPQSDLDAVRSHPMRGLRVDAAAQGDSTWARGVLVFVDNQFDPASGTLLLKGEFENRDGMLWPGAFVRVRLRFYDEDRAVVVPTPAVSNSQKGTYLYVVKADTTVEARPVVVSRTWGNLSVISAGVDPGETVVTDGQLRLSPGARAQVRPAASNHPGTRR
jgi:multidrug efflux system membrane fusion protein